MLFKGLFLAALPVAFAAPAPGTINVPLGDAPPSGVTIEGISYAGSGCNAGSVAGAISSDLSTVTLLYDSFIAQAGAGIQPAEARKNCQLNLQLKLPQGWQFSVFKADYRGYAFLQQGDKGVIKSTYYFSGDSSQVRCSSEGTNDFFNKMTNIGPIDRSLPSKPSRARTMTTTLRRTNLVSRAPFGPPAVRRVCSTSTPRSA